MNPIIKWAGGKEKELPYIKESLPDNINRYIEPFVGGGAVYFNLNIKNSIINDKSEELINLYKCIKKQDKEFFSKLKSIYKNWRLLEKIVENNAIELLRIYRDYCKELNKNSENTSIKIKFNDKIYAFVIKHAEEFNGILSDEFNIEIDNFINEIVKNLISKMNRMYKIENQRKNMSEKDTLDNIECAFKSAFYMHFRHLYNEAGKLNINASFYTAIFYFIREFCYASMFRYNKNGKFNVPYGGISYNRKEFIKKINYIGSKEIKEYMEQTKIYCEDFESFLVSFQNRNDKDVEHLLITNY